MGRYAVGMLDWTGLWWDFTRDWVAGIKAGGIDDLVGSTVDVTAAPLGAPGQLVLSQQGDVTTGSVVFHCRGDGHRDAGQVAADLRRAFSPLISRRSMLRVESPMGAVDGWVRRNGRMPAPVQDPSWDEMVLDVQVPLVLDSGVWLAPVVVDDGSVVVANSGDVPVWVSIRWDGAGGKVTLPSGATFMLPPVAEQRVLHLRKTPTVLDVAGVRDEALWRQLRPVMPEMVPVGEVREFTVPTGARVEYRLGVLDPWQ